MLKHRGVINGVISLLTVTVGFAGAAFAQSRNSDITVVLEEPSINETKSGVSNLRGFAVTLARDCPIVRVELFIDGVFRGNIPLGGLRADVCNVFDVTGCENSGFSQAINYSNFAEGAHEATVHAVDCVGDFNDTSASFSTDRFDNPFIANSISVDFQATKASIEPGVDGLDKRIFLQSVSAFGRCYNVVLDYTTAMQGWQIVSIVDLPVTECLPDLSAFGGASGDNPIGRLPSP